MIVTLTKNRILSGYEVPLGLLKHVITIGYTSPSNKKVIRDFLVANYQILAAQKVNRREELYGSSWNFFIPQACLLVLL